MKRIAFLAVDNHLQLEERLLLKTGVCIDTKALRTIRGMNGAVGNDTLLKVLRLEVQAAG